MRTYSYFFLWALCGLLSCQPKGGLHIEGTIQQADGDMLYLSEIGVAGTTLLDSAKLASNGEFSFTRPAVDSPTFFSLRVGQQQLTLVADSTETIRISGKGSDLANHYRVAGSSTSQEVQQIAAAGRVLRRDIHALHLASTAQTIHHDTYTDSLTTLIDAYKAQVRPYIFDHPRSGAAYFALFQRVEGLLLFNPNNPLDYPAYGAVATSWDTFYPHTARSKQLKNITLTALKFIRDSKLSPDELPEAEAQNYIEIELADLKGRNQKLSSLQGKVVLLDFTAYESEYSGPYNMRLAELYDRYADQGFAIYQVSLDPNEHFWKVTASNLPWVSVRDANSIYSHAARSYNVSELPTSFLLDRTGAIVARTTSLEETEKALRKLL